MSCGQYQWECGSDVVGHVSKLVAVNSRVSHDRAMGTLARPPCNDTVTGLEFEGIDIAANTTNNTSTLIAKLVVVNDTEGGGNITEIDG